MEVWLRPRWSLSWGQTEVSFSKGPQHRSLTHNHQVGSWAPGSEGGPAHRAQDPGAILLVLLPDAIWALLETPCLAQLAAQLLLVGLLHGFNGWKQGRKAEGGCREQLTKLGLLQAHTCTVEARAGSAMQRALGRAVSRTEWLWVRCSTSLNLSSKGR